MYYVQYYYDWFLFRLDTYCLLFEWELLLYANDNYYHYVINNNLNENSYCFILRMRSITTDILEFENASHLRGLSVLSTSISNY
jgi:hypothetical protein